MHGFIMVVVFIIYLIGELREMIGIRKLISAAALSGAIILGVTSASMAQTTPVGLTVPGVAISDAVIQQIQAASKNKAALLAVLRAQIAASPELAAQLAAMVASANPEAAAEVASIAAEAAPEAAVAIATSVAQAVPESAAEIASSVSEVVPEAAVEIASAVSEVVPEAAAEIVAAVVEAVPDAAVEVAANTNNENTDGTDGSDDVVEVVIDTPSENQTSDASAN